MGVELGPLVPGEVLHECFVLARDIREVDMRASPYDMSPWGCEPIRIETDEGKAEYSAFQRGFADRSNELRPTLLAAIARARGVVSPDSVG